MTKMHKMALAHLVLIGQKIVKNTKNNHNKMSINFKPNEDRILVEPAPAEEKLHQESSFLIPQRKTSCGTVVAIGDGTSDKPVQVKVGDIVLYGKYSGTELNIEGTDYLVMKNADVLGTLI